jgi:hypothetical protein
MSIPPGAFFVARSYDTDGVKYGLLQVVREVVIRQTGRVAQIKKATKWLFIKVFQVPESIDLAAGR